MISIYFTAAEALAGRTVGKALLGLRVRHESGAKVTWRQALVRNLMRVVDELPAMYLVGIASVAVGPRPQRLGDRMARTMVVTEPARPLV